MRVARWKVMAGGLLLSAGGLMAVADGPVPVPGCQPMPLPAFSVPAAPAVTQVRLDAPVPVPPPKTAELPALPQPASFPAPALPPTPPPAKTEPAAPPVMPLTLPPVGSPAAPPPPVRSEPFLNSINADPLPAAPAPAVPTDRPPPEPKKPEAVPASAAEKRLKVVLHMGDDRPRFEVRDGDEIYLKVVSDRVEVKSAADKGDTATMKAGGKVAFVTPGGDGTCDELAILPGSGQVVAVGNVAFRHTWGRSETTVTAERMTFRLAHPGPTAIQAGYTPVK